MIFLFSLFFINISFFHYFLLIPCSSSPLYPYNVVSKWFEHTAWLFPNLKSFLLQEKVHFGNKFGSLVHFQNCNSRLPLKAEVCGLIIYCSLYFRSLLQAPTASLIPILIICSYLTEILDCNNKSLSTYPLAFRLFTFSYNLAKQQCIGIMVSLSVKRSIIKMLILNNSKENEWMVKLGNCIYL